MDCVIRVIEGPDQGLVYEPVSGENVIGRGAAAHMKLSAPDVSYEHAVVTRGGEEYFIQNLSAMGTLVDETKITTQVRLRPNAKIRLSPDTVLRLEPAGEGGGLLANRGMLGALVLLLTGALAVLLVWNPFAPPKRADDWEAAYRHVVQWLSQESKAGRVPEQSIPLFQEAWRLEQMKDWAHSYPAWMRLQLLLDNLEDKHRFNARAAQHPRALQNLLTPPPNALAPEYDQSAAAFVQFVNRRLAWSIKQYQLTKPGLKLGK